MAIADITMNTVSDESSTDALVHRTKWTVHGMSEKQVHERSFLIPIILVEVRLRSRAAARFDTVRNAIQAYLNTLHRIIIPCTLDGWQDIPELASSVERVVISESACPSNTLSLQETALQIHVYQPSDADSFEEFSNSAGVRDDDDDTMAASVCELPNRSWEGLWDSLIYTDNIKMKLLDYIHATLVLSDANVDCESPYFHCTGYMLI